VRQDQSVKGMQFTAEVIRWAVRWYLMFPSVAAKGVASRKLWHALRAADKYLRGQAVWLINFANGTVPVCALERRSPRAQ
jgi:hypothetical protein